MKICKIIYTYAPYSIGGADIYAETVSKELLGRNHSVVIITISHLKEESITEEGNIKIYRIRPFNISTLYSIGSESFVKQGIWMLFDIYSLYSLSKIIKILKHEKPDVVHLHTPIDITLSVFTAIKKLKLPLVFSLHDYLLMCRRISLLHGNGKVCTPNNMHLLCKVYKKISKRIVNNIADIVLAPSKFIGDFYRGSGFFEKSKMVFLPHGIKINDLCCSRNINKKDTEFTILYVGGLAQHKGVHILIEAVKGIKRKELKLNIVGDGIYKDRLVSLAGNDPRIIFTGKIENSSVNHFYDQADVVVVPSIWYEVFGIVIQEAFRAGKPVIGSNIGGIPELVKHRYNGFLFEPGNVIELRKILEEVINKPDIFNILEKNAHESFKQFEMSKYMDKLIDVYKEAIEISRKRL